MHRTTTCCMCWTRLITKYQGSQTEAFRSLRNRQILCFHRQILERDEQLSSNSTWCLSYMPRATFASQYNPSNLNLTWSSFSCNYREPIRQIWYSWTNLINLIAIQHQNFATLHRYACCQEWEAKGNLRSGIGRPVCTHTLFLHRFE